MANPDAVTLEERIFQLEKVFFTGLELLLGTKPENLESEQVDALFDAHEKVVSRTYDSDEDFRRAVQERNKALKRFREYVVESFVRDADFDREYTAVRAESLAVLLGGGRVDGKEIMELYRDLRRLEDKKDLEGIRNKLSGLDANGLVGNLAAAYGNTSLKSSIADSADRMAYYSQLCAPFLEDSKLANVLSEVGAVVTEIYFGVCEREVVSFSSVVGEVSQLLNSKRYGI